MDELREEIMKKSLQQAKNLLDRETAQTADTARAVRELVETAISIQRSGYESPIGPGMQDVCVFKKGKVKIEKR